MGTSASFACRALSCLAAALLAFAFVPTSAFAQEEAEQPQGAVDPQAGEPQEAGSDQADEESGSTSAASPAEGGTLASALVGTPTAFINSDVALDGEPVIGSFTVDGMTFAVTEGSDVELVGVSSDRQQLAGLQEGDGSPVAPMFASGPDESNADGLALAIPESISYEGVDYAVTSIGAYAFYLSGVASVELPATATDVDDRAFRSSDVASVEVADGNPSYSSFDGALYSADYSSLLLIPEGKQGAVRIPSTAEEVDPGAFSHCALAEAISVDAGSAAFASENGLLYTSDLTTLLRVPAGATDIVIRDGCTTIAAGAMEACASLETITAPASVTSISPDVFTSVPTVSLTAVSAVADDPADTVQADEAEGAFGSEVPTSPQPPSASSAEASGTTTTQLMAMVALSSSDDDMPEVDPSAIRVESTKDELASCWEMLGFCADGAGSADAAGLAFLQSAEGAQANGYRVSATIHSRDGATLVLKRYDSAHNLISEQDVGTTYTINANGSVVAIPSLVGFHLTANDPGYDYCQIVPTKAGYSCIGFEGTAQIDASHPTYPVVDGDVLTAIYGAPYSFTINAGAGGLLDVDRFWQSTDAVGEPYLHDVESYAASYSGFAGVSDDQRFIGIWEPADSRSGWYYKATPKRAGYHVSGWSGGPIAPACTVTAQWTPNSYTVSFSNPAGALVSPIDMTYGVETALPAPAERADFVFHGWDTLADGSGTRYQAGQRVSNLTSEENGSVVLYAQWERVGFDVSYDVDSEPRDEDYPGDIKEDEKVNIKDGQVQIEDPKRPGYVFQGWVIPNAGGTEAIDQDLVYKADDGKWYVDASKLPDYADGDGRVELTARWTSVISVDVPSRVTFLADVVTQGQGSRDGLVQGAFAQAKAVNRSEVDLRIVGLEAEAAGSGDGALGADAILRQAPDATPASSAQKLLSVYPSDDLPTSDELKDPTRASSLPDGAVGFDLGDTLLEAAFDPEAFAIPAGGQLSLGYRLNLAETATELDYDALSSLDPGESAQIATVSYTFAGDPPYEINPTGSEDEPLWVEISKEESDALGPLYAAPGIYGLADIKSAASDLAAFGQSSVFFRLYQWLLDAQRNKADGTRGEGPFFNLKANGAFIDVQVIGICQDTSASGGIVGLSFQTAEAYACSGVVSAAGGSGAFNNLMNPTKTNTGGWSSSALRTTMRSAFLAALEPSLLSSIVAVRKTQQLYGSNMQTTTDETVWLPSLYEVYGMTIANYNNNESGFQYMAYQGNAGSTTNIYVKKTFNGMAVAWWTRSAYRGSTTQFCTVNGEGYRHGAYASDDFGVIPCFCL